MEQALLRHEKKLAMQDYDRALLRKDMQTTI